MILKNARKVRAVYVLYGRGRITWQEATSRLVALGVPAGETAGILLGTTHIVGY